MSGIKVVRKLLIFKAKKIVFIMMKMGHNCFQSRTTGPAAPGATRRDKARREAVTRRRTTRKLLVEPNDFGDREKGRSVDADRTRSTPNFLPGLMASSTKKRNARLSGRLAVRPPLMSFNNPKETRTMCTLMNIKPTVTYASEANAIKAVAKAFGDRAEGLRYFIARTLDAEARFFPVFVGQDAVTAGVHFRFHVVA